MTTSSVSLEILGSSFGIYSDWVILIGGGGGGAEVGFEMTGGGGGAPKGLTICLAELNEFVVSEVNELLIAVVVDDKVDTGEDEVVEMSQIICF